MFNKIIDFENIGKREDKKDYVYVGFYFFILIIIGIFNIVLFFHTKNFNIKFHSFNCLFF